jgi:signal transduction histidine kinase/DNA-binding NarL/FixJ family response regulator
VTDTSSGIETKSAKDKSGTVRGRLFRKYVALLVFIVSVPLLAIGGFNIWTSYQDHKNSLTRLQNEQVQAAADKIGQFVKEIEGQVAWIAQLAGLATAEQRRFEMRLLLRQVPAITELVQVDGDGREELLISRIAPDVIGSRTDWAQEPKFIEAMTRKIYYGPVYFRGESEPYMTLAIAGPVRTAGVVIAEVNLKFIWDVVSRIKAGQDGKAYVVDGSGRLIAHPDISLVLGNTDFSRLDHVRAALREASGTLPEKAQVASDLSGRSVIAAHAPIAPPGWLMFVELPLEEAYAPLYASLLATALVLLAGLVLAVLSSFMLAQKMVTPIRALQTGADRIGAGALDHRLAISTGDELEALGRRFNSMAAQLQQSYETLERKVDERTHQLKLANLAKSRFLAAASHDLRQPLHALGLFVAQLDGKVGTAEGREVLARINSAVLAMDDLFNALLDVSKLDAEVLKPNLRRFPIQTLFRRLETTFAGAAREKELLLRVVPSTAWVSSDFILLERIMMNLASNAVRYTDCGGIVIGARRRGSTVRLEVWDSGSGIPNDQLQNIFAEFYQIGGPQTDRGGGLGLGLAIVERLCSLLGHRIEVTSTPGRGSRFAVSVPLAPADVAFLEPAAPVPAIDEPCRGKQVLVIDDDAMVLAGMRGLLVSWGCHVATAGNDQAALAALAGHKPPDLIISDYRLPAGKTGFEAIARLREAFGMAIPAFLISGDTAPERLREAAASGFHLLHKPVPPNALRAMVSQLLREDTGTRREIEGQMQISRPDPRPSADSSPAPWS